MGKYNSYSDKELLTCLYQSDHAAYTEIYDRYFTMVYTHACKKLADQQQAKDIVQEVFASLWFDRHSGLQTESIPGYLISAIRNKVFGLLANGQIKQKHFESLQEFFSLNPIVSTDHRVRNAQFKAYIDQLVNAKSPKIALRAYTAITIVFKPINDALKHLKLW